MRNVGAVAWRFAKSSSRPNERCGWRASTNRDRARSTFGLTSESSPLSWARLWSL